MNELQRMKVLLDYCDKEKKYYRKQKYTLAEEMFAYLEFKVGMMYELIMMYKLNDLIENHPTIQSYQGIRPVNDMKIFEIQTLIFPHFVSIIESSIRKLLQERNIVHKDVLLNDIIEYLYNKKIISEDNRHLWDGIRHIRNAIVHYNSHAKITNTYKYTDEISVKLEKNKVMESKDIFENFKIIEWMTKNIKTIINSLK